MSEDSRDDRAARYREQAAACRLSAEEAPSEAARTEFLRLAGEWDQLASEVTEWSIRFGRPNGTKSSP
jgi:hypothetical protein